MAIEDHMGGGGPEEEEDQSPPWLKPLLEEHFFGQCNVHLQPPKNECNMYCLDCTSGALCSLCLEHHNDHRTIQIRKSSYHQVITVKEMQMHLDISRVQTYVVNSEKTVFLNERPQHGRVKRATTDCNVCSRGLVDNRFCFCSLGCQVAGSSRSFEKGVKHTLMELESLNNSSGVEDNIPSPQSLTPSTPQVPTSNSSRKRPRKGIPHPSPLQ